ncbi:uncharacterized protein LOC126106652 isoform X3 [Schistocerca cancellata]|uniref:uncharacterized protein LOC126106652 isoform X3 n=1 Tax=Schistocerca cancellata TaxID=274614 RepID=UPI002119762B|nr:uncharacterized protein LOC126106652 isoform X3 [Schistocerca cancellata]
MESAGEEIEIKEEPISTDPYQPPEIEQIYIKEENVKLETPEDNDAHDPLKVEEDEFVSEEETGSPPDAIHIKKEPLRPWKNLRDAYMKHKMLAKDTTDLNKNMYKL